MMNQKLLVALVIFAVCSLSSATSKSCVQKLCPKNVKEVILLPVVDDCEKFIACYNGRSLIRSCADKYRFDASIQACAPKKLVECNECNDDSEEDSAESSESDEVKDVIYKPEPEKEVEEIQPEPEKEVEEIKPEPEKEIEEIKPETEISTEASPTEEIPESCKNNSVTPVSCPSDLEDDRLFSHPDDCHLFYYCVDSPSGYLPICRECPAGLHFNPVKKVCDFSEVAGCKSKKKRSVMEPCNEQNGEFADLRPDPEDCNKYYVCDWGTLIHMSCPEGMHFSTMFKLCDIPQNARCESGNSSGILNRKIEDKSEESKEESGISAILESDVPAPQNNISQRCIDNSVTHVSCPAVLPDDRLLPHPDDCELFYYCVSESLPPICRDCPAGLHFNPIKKVCDRPENAGCKLKSGEESAVLPKSRALEPCNEHNGVWADLRPDPENCSMYYVCDWGNLIHMPCPAGLHFNVMFKVCDLPENARCETTEIYPA